MCIIFIGIENFKHLKKKMSYLPRVELVDGELVEVVDACVDVLCPSVDVGALVELLDGPDVGPPVAVGAAVAVLCP